MMAIWGGGSIPWRFLSAENRRVKCWGINGERVCGPLVLLVNHLFAVIMTLGTHSFEMSYSYYTQLRFQLKFMSMLFQSILSQQGVSINLPQSAYEATSRPFGVKGANIPNVQETWHFIHHGNHSTTCRGQRSWQGLFAGLSLNKQALTINRPIDILKLSNIYVWCVVRSVIHYST